MSGFELTFIVDPVDVEVENAVIDTFDCVVGKNHIGDSFIAMVVDGTDAVQSAKTAHMQLVGLGVRVDRLEYDLVDRAQMADRLEMTPQAIGNYIRGERHKSAPFPRAFNETGPVWLWGDIVSWSRQVRRIDPCDGLLHPNRHEIAEFNSCIDRAYALPAELTTSPYRVFHASLAAQVVPNVDFGWGAASVRVFIDAPAADVWHAGDFKPLTSWTHDPRPPADIHLAHIAIDTFKGTTR